MRAMTRRLGRGDPDRRRRGERGPARGARARGAREAAARDPRLRRRWAAAPRGGARAARPGGGHLRHGLRRGAPAAAADPRHPARRSRAPPRSGARRRPCSSISRTSTSASPRSSRSSGSRSSTTCRPTIWAWRKGRAKKIAKVVDRMLCILPFEPRCYEGTGVRARFVGHPFAERPPPDAPAALPRRARPRGRAHHRRARAGQPTLRAEAAVRADARGGRADQGRPPGRAVRRPGRTDAAAGGARAVPRAAHARST